MFLEWLLIPDAYLRITTLGLLGEPVKFFWRML
jgi:hypothetical protein